jgi:uncharacterized protein
MKLWATQEPQAPKPATAPQPATAIASHRVRPDALGAFIQAQTEITDAARRFPGFIGTEVLEPVVGLQEEWVAIFRLDSNQAMKRWLEDPDRLKLAAKIEQLLLEPSHLLLLASDDRTEPPAAMVFTHRVAAAKADEYMAWRRKVIAAQALYPGYLATESFEPHGQSGEWVDVVRFDSVGHLNAWMESRERRELHEQLDSIVESVHEHPITGLEGWFSVNRGPGMTALPPPPWKQAFAVLIALYPTVMALSYLNPLMSSLSLPVQMLIGNILSVALLTWLVMPLVSGLFEFWLCPRTNSRGVEVLGLGIMIGGIATFVVLFRLLAAALR